MAAIAEARSSNSRRSSAHQRERKAHLADTSKVKNGLKEAVPTNM
jgi:hypothetical protein